MPDCKKTKIKKRYDLSTRYYKEQQRQRQGCLKNMQHKTGKDRNQIQFISMNDWISEDNPVKVIDAFVDSLSLRELGFSHAVVKSEGCPPYDPAMMLKLYLYGYSGGAKVRSTRKLEAECKRNIELMWLIAEMQPSHTTISAFRKEHPKELKAVFKKFGLFLRSEGLMQGNEVCIDGTKIRGLNSKANNYTQKDVEGYLEWLEKKNEEYLQQLDEADKEEERTGINPLEIKQEAVKNLLKNLKEKKEKYEGLKKQMEQTNSTQVSTTDTDTRLMHAADGGNIVGYNIQSANHTQHSLIVDFAVTNEGDRHALHSTAVAAKETLGVQEITAITDKGYHAGTELQACEKDHIITLVAPQEYVIPCKVPDERYHADKFVYNKEQDSYTCPQGHSLRTNGTWLKRTKKLGRGDIDAKYKEYKTAQCLTCPLKHLCTRADKGRVLTRFEYQEAIDANNKRVAENKEAYQKRKCVSEHPFGTVKRAWGYSYTLLKGMKKVTGEISLIFTCYNMRRAITILGVVGLVAKLNAWNAANAG